MRPVLVLALVLAPPVPAQAGSDESGSPATRIAGGPDDFMQVVHLRVQGSNFEIGKRLARYAERRFGTRPPAAKDPLRVRARQRYFERNYPIHFQRMRGVAAAFGHDLEAATHDCSQLGFDEIRAGCSVVFYPKFHGLRQRTAGVKGLTIPAIRGLQTCAAATRGSAADPRPPGRTLWHSIYLPEQRAVEVDFYLGDVDAQGGGPRERRSEPRRFVLGESGK